MFWLSLHKFKRSLLTASARVIEAAIVATIILIGGLGSSWYMVEAGSRLTTAKLGPWMTPLLSGIRGIKGIRGGGGGKGAGGRGVQEEGGAAVKIFYGI